MSLLKPMDHELDIAYARAIADRFSAHNVTSVDIEWLAMLFDARARRVGNPVDQHDARRAEQERDELAKQCAALRVTVAKLEGPVPIRLECPACGNLHVDEGEFAEKPHHTHACQTCGAVWRPAVVCTVGVRFLPGFGPA